MAPPRGSYNARRFHEEKLKQGREKLSLALQTVARTGVVFKNISALAEHIAERCDQTAGNLRRNAVYREMLEAHLANQRGAVGVISERHRDVSVLRAKLLAAGSEAANARRDAKRLENFIASHMSSSTLPSGGATASVVGSRDQKEVDYRQAFECTAHALVAVIERAEIFEVDERKQEIRDRSARPGNQGVVAPAHAHFFVNWLLSRKNSSRGS